MSRKRLWLHYFGLATSFLCLIHCLITPILIVIFPLLFKNSAHGIKYEVFFILLLALASLTFWQGFMIHQSKRSLYTAAIGFALLCMSLFMHHSDLNILFSTSGGACMLLAHYWNYKLCRCHGHHH